MLRLSISEFLFSYADFIFFLFWGVSTGYESGRWREDVCGVCGGDGTSCVDCAGVPFGFSVFDSCRTCGGSDWSCSPSHSLSLFAGFRPSTLPRGEGAGGSGVVGEWWLGQMHVCAGDKVVLGWEVVDVGGARREDRVVLFLPGRSGRVRSECVRLCLRLCLFLCLCMCLCVCLCVDGCGHVCVSMCVSVSVSVSVPVSVFMAVSVAVIAPVSVSVSVSVSVYVPVSMSTCVPVSVSVSK